MGLVLVYGALIAELARFTNNLNVGSDFVEYWAAASLNLAGQSPYAESAVGAIQRDLGYQFTQPTMMYNPPWVITIVLPLPLLPYRAALMLWLTLLFAVVLVCSDSLWRLYGGSPRKRWVAWLLGMLFVPALVSLAFGQISPLILLGATMFLWASKNGRWVQAGLAAALFAIKPQLTYLYWPALLIWALQERRWQVPLAGLAATAVATIIPLAFNPAVLVQYVQAYTAQPPLFWASAVPAAVPRLLFGEEKAWLQFVPSVIGLVWLARRWRAQHTSWLWEEQLPPLLLVSYVTASYGWTFDQVVFIPALMQVSVWILPNWRSQWPIWLSYLAASGLMVTMRSLAIPDLLAAWYAPTLLLIYWLARRAMTREATANGYAQKVVA